jgi:hypothetical protein
VDFNSSNTIYQSEIGVSGQALVHRFVCILSSVVLVFRKWDIHNCKQRKYLVNSKIIKRILFESKFFFI